MPWRFSFLQVAICGDKERMNTLVGIIFSTCAPVLQYFPPTWGIFYQALLRNLLSGSSLRPRLFYSPSVFPFPTFPPLVLSISAYYIAPFLQLYACPDLPHTHSSYLLFILLFHFSSKCCFHYLTILSLHNLYKLTLVPVSLLNVSPKVQITKSNGLFSKLNLDLDRIGHYWPSK